MTRAQRPGTPPQKPRTRARASGRSTRNLWLVGIAVVLLAAIGVLAFLSRGSANQHPTFAQLVVGECLELPQAAITPAPPTSTPVPVEPGASPTPGPSPTPAPPEDATSAAVLAGQATRVQCPASHTHEVVGTTGIKIGDKYLGRAFLLNVAGPACRDAFATYVGHALDGSQLALTIVVPDQAAWDRKEQRAVCLVSRADGTATTGTAKGSGR